MSVEDLESAIARLSAEELAASLNGSRASWPIGGIVRSKQTSRLVAWMRRENEPTGISRLDVVPTLKHFASPEFWFHYRQLPENIRDLADKNFALLKADRRHRSISWFPLSLPAGISSQIPNIRSGQPTPRRAGRAQAKESTFVGGNCDRFLSRVFCYFQHLIVSLSILVGTKLEVLPYRCPHNKRQACGI